MVNLKTTLLFVLLISILIVCSWVAYWVYGHYEVYNNDPLVYGAKVHDISFCNCMKNNGNELSFNQETVTTRLINNNPIEDSQTEKINMSSFIFE